MHGLTRGKVVQMYYGVRAPYQEIVIRYGITQGYPRKEGGGLVAQRGVLRRGPVGAGKRGRDGAGVGVRRKAGGRPQYGREARAGQCVPLRRGKRVGRARQGRGNEHGSGSVR